MCSDVYPGLWGFPYINFAKFILINDKVWSFFYKKLYSNKDMWFRGCNYDLRFDAGWLFTRCWNNSKCVRLIYHTVRAFNPTSIRFNLTWLCPSTSCSRWISDFEKPFSILLLKTKSIFWTYDSNRRKWKSY